MPTLLFHTAEDLLGDALIKLPVLLALKAARPDITLIWSAGQGRSQFAGGLKPLVASTIDELHEATGLGTRWSQVFKPFWRRHFDCIVASERRLLPTLALKRLSHDQFVAPMRNFALATCQAPVAFAREPLHCQTRILLELATGQPLSPRLNLPLPEEYRALAQILLPAGWSYIGLAPGAGGKDKCWPLGHFVAVAQAQVARGRVPVFFLGPAEGAWLPALRLAVPEALFPESDPRASLAGPLLAIALASRLSLALANDSGAGHLLAAGGRPLVSLFGRTDPHKFAPPYGSRTVIRARDLGLTQVQDIPLGHVLQVMELVLG